MSQSTSSNMHSVTRMEMNTEYATAVRFPAWVSLVLFSIVCMVAMCTDVDRNDRGPQEKFVVAVTAISFGISFLAMLGYLMARSMFKSSVIELSMIVMMAAFWGIGLFYIMAPDNGIAVSGGIVTNANLYFFSWINFMLIIFLMMSYLQETVGLDARETPGKQARWFFFLASSLVVLGVASRIYGSETGCGYKATQSDKFCKRTVYAICVGAISVITAMIMSYFASLVGPMIDFGVTVILLGLWTFAVSLVTFGSNENSPGSTIGNLFFSTWISFILVVMLFGYALQDFAGLRSTTTTTNEPTQQSTNNTTGSLPNEEDF